MRITRSQLRRIIREELDRLSEQSEDPLEQALLGQSPLGEPIPWSLPGGALGFQLARAGGATVGAAGSAALVYGALAAVIVAGLGITWVSLGSRRRAKKEVAERLVASALLRAVTGVANKAKTAISYFTHDGGPEAEFYRNRVTMIFGNEEEGLPGAYNIIKNPSSSEDDRLDAIKEIVSSQELMAAFDQITEGVTEEHFYLDSEEIEDLRRTTNDWAARNLSAVSETWVQRQLKLAKEDLFTSLALPDEPVFTKQGELPDESGS